MQIKVCAHNAATFSCLGLKSTHSWWQRNKNPKSLGSLAPLLNCAHNMLSAVLSCVYVVYGHFLNIERDAVDVSHNAQPL